ncbi:MAG: nucleotide exchange factor GrpE [Candidatus Promineifilaceae bacterium]
MSEDTTLSDEQLEAEETPEIVDGQGSETAETGSEAEELTLEEQLTAAQSKAAEYLDGWQRERAEFANARKRLEKQRAEAYKNAAVDHAAKLLPILDDFDRALSNVPSEIAADSWFEGIQLVRRKLQTIMEGLKVEAIEAVGQPFDPNFHEALALKDADGVESGTVIEELLVGYRMGDRVIRPSLVNVAA